MLYENKPHIKKVTAAWEDADWAPHRKKDLAGKLNIHIECRVTGEMYTVQVIAGDTDRWLRLGHYAQEVFSYLSADDRELLISGTSPEGWSNLFGAGASNDPIENDKQESAIFKLKNNQV